MTLWINRSNWRLRLAATFGDVFAQQPPTDEKERMLSLLEDGKRIIIEQYDMRVGDDGHSECIELMIVID